MNTSSYFIKDKALFGSYPDENTIKEFEEMGVVCYVDLTEKHEKNIEPYKTTGEIMCFPIEDRSIPSDLEEFTKFIIKVSAKIKNLREGEKIYVHCKGGHGRSGVVVACILCHIFKLSAYESLLYTSQCHKNRLIMRDKWRKIGSPQTYIQKKFVHTFFKPLNYTRMNRGLFSLYNVDYNVFVEEINKSFDSIKEVVEYCKRFGKIKSSEEELIKYILKIRIYQNTELQKELQQTLLKPIVAYNENEKYICNELTIIRKGLL